MTGATAVVPTWNRRDLLAKLLGSIRGQTVPFRRILVVDNGSTDGSSAAAREAGADVLELARNEGFAAAVNKGVAAADTPLVAVLNNDVLLAPDWLERLARALEGGAWFAAGKILDARRPGFLDGSYDLVCRGGCAFRAGHSRPDSPDWDRPKPIDIAPFTAVLAKRELFRRAGNLDERFESYLEDVDFGMRCAREGLTGIYEPRARVWHEGSATLGAWHPDTIRRIARNQVFLVARHYPPGWALRDGWKVVAAQLLWGLLAARHGSGWAFVRGKWEGIRRWEELRANVSGAGARQVGELLRTHEREILDLQRRQGFDVFWRLYFALT